MPISPVSTSLQRPGVLRTWSDTDALPLLFITGCWLLMVLLVDPRGEFPLNDDWVYALAVKSVVETGYFQFPSPASANVGPQVYWGALFCLPFGFSFTALRLSTLTLGLVGACAFYCLVRQANGARWLAALCALVLAANPLYFALSNTFMTDVPFIAMSLVAMCLLFYGLRKESLACVVAGLLVVFSAILIRQLAIVVIVGYVFATLAKEGFTFGRVTRGIALIALGLAVHFGYQFWLVHTGRVPVATVHANVQTLIPTAAHLLPKVKTLAASLFYTGFLVAPFAVLLWFRSRPPAPTRDSRSALFVHSAVALTIFAALWYVDRLMPASGNVLIRSGVGPLLLFDTETLRVNQPSVPPVATALWAAVSLLSIAAILTMLRLLASPTSDLAASISNRRRATANWQYAFFAVIALSYLLILVLISGRVGIFDRYHLLFLPLVILMICSAMPPRALEAARAGRLTAALLVFLFAAFSVAATHDFLAWSHARWNALRDLVAQGISPQRIDGGYEFNGWNLWHLHAPTYELQNNRSWWWVVDDEYVIASGSLPNYVELKRYTFSHWLFGRESQILTMRKKDLDRD